MRYNLLYIFIAFACLGFVSKDQSYRKITNKFFTTGEHLEYRVHYGFINAGEAVIKVHPKIFNINSRPCYKVDIFGKTSGTFDLMIKVRDNWGSYVDTASMIPHRHYRVIEEGKYRRNELTNFDHLGNNVEVKVLDNKTKEYKPSKNFKVPTNVQDMVSGYYFLRTVDYSKLKIGDVVSVPAFFEDTIYDFRVRYLGREMLDTKFGELKSFILSPIMPENEMFDGENSIRLWISDDSNRIPLKIQADMFIGAVEIDLKKYKGLRNGN